MNRGTINNILPLKEGKTDCIAFITPQGSQPRVNDIACFLSPIHFKKGDSVEYEETTDRSGRPQARNVRKMTGGEPARQGGQVAGNAPTQKGRPNDAPARPVVAERPQTTTHGCLTPRATSEALSVAWQNPRSLHPGLLQDRYVPQECIGNQEKQKTHLDRIVQAQPLSAKDYKDLRTRLEGGPRYSFIAKADARLVLHLSRAGGLENASVCLHPIHGFAYLPGSGLKGLAQAYAAHLWASRQFGGIPKEDFARLIEDIFGWSPNKERQDPAEPFDPRSGQLESREREALGGDMDVIEAQVGAVIFHDAFAEIWPKLDVDVLTNHYSDYYKSAAVPGDWMSPNPVSFLTIASGTQFRIRLSPRTGSIHGELLCKAATGFLMGGLQYLGAGAKTAAGYGSFSIETPVVTNQNSAKAPTDQDGGLEAIYGKLDHSKQVLWVPKNQNSTSGYRLVYSEGRWSRSAEEWAFKESPKAGNRAVVLADIKPNAERRLAFQKLLLNQVPKFAP